jgi:hypothetical protein
VSPPEDDISDTIRDGPEESVAVGSSSVGEVGLAGWKKADGSNEGYG